MRELIVTEGAGERLDLWLSRYGGKLSRSAYHASITEGSILVNGKKAKPSFRMKLSDRISITSDEMPVDPLRKISGNLDIVFEDENLLVINKPAGIAVHPGERGKEITLVNLLLNYYPKLQNVGESPLRPGIVHRLDKETSGLMVVAKNNKTFETLKRAWQEGEVKKKYLALVWGGVLDEGRIDLPITRSKRTGRMVGKKEGEKKALTLYQTLSRYTNATLVEVETKTGRTHQIRAHFKALGHPLVGDPLYRYAKGGKKTAPRLFLHAHSLTLPYGEQNLPRTWTMPLPHDLKEFLKTLKKRTI